MLFAVDAQGKPHASVYLVWDAKTIYSLMRGSDPILRTSGATSLLMWKAIEFASSQGKRFDFAGSWVESIERFVRAFGGRQTPFFEVSKINSKLVPGYRTLKRWIHRTGWAARDIQARTVDER